MSITEEIVLTVDSLQAQEAVKKFASNYGIAMKSVASSTEKASKEVESAFSKKAKAVTSLDQQMAGLLTRFFGVGGLIMGVKALASGLVDISPHAQRVEQSFSNLSDTFMQGIANAQGFQTAMEGVADAIQQASDALGVMFDLSRNAVMQDMGILGQLFVWGDAALTGGANLPDEFYDAAYMGRAAPPKKYAKRSAAGGRGARAKGHGQFGNMSMNDALSGLGVDFGLEDDKLVDELVGGMQDKSLPLDEQVKMFEPVLDAHKEVARQEKKLLDERAQAYEQFTGIMGDISGSLTSALLGGLVDMAKGQEVAWDKIIADLLTRYGTELFASGVKDVALGTSRALGSYGLDATAYGLITSGGIAMGAGAVMLAGGLPLTFAAYQGGGGGGSSGGGMGAGRGVSGQATGAPTTQEDHWHITVIGKPSAEMGQLFVDSVEERRRLRG